MARQGQNFKLGIKDLFLSPVFPELPAPAEFQAPFGGILKRKAKRPEKFPSKLVDWTGCITKPYNTVEVLSGVRPHDGEMELTAFEQAGFQCPLELVENSWHLRHLDAVADHKESSQARAYCGRTLWFLFHNIAKAASENRDVTYQFCKEKRSSSVPSHTLSQQMSSHKQTRLLPGSHSAAATACDALGTILQVKEQQPDGLRRSTRVSQPTNKALASEQGTGSRFVEVGNVLSGASQYTCQVDSAICEVLDAQEDAQKYATTKVVFEFKGSDTLGLVDERLHRISADQGSLTWDEVVKVALEHFGENTERDHVYGSLIQLLNTMLLKGAEVGVLHDLQTYIFVELRRRASENGEEVDTVSKLTAKDFTVSYLVKRYSDCEPTMQQVLVHFLRKYAEAGASASWVRKVGDLGGHRRQLLMDELSRMAVAAAVTNVVHDAAPNDTKVVRARGSGIRDSSHMRSDDIADKTLRAKAFDFQVDKLGFQVALSNGSPIWHYDAKVNHVLKLAHWDDTDKAACLERELRAYVKASKLQGSVLLKLHDHGEHAEARVDVLELDYLCVPVGIPSFRFYEQAVSTAIWQAYRALWAEGVAHCDIYEGNICVHVCKEDGGSRFKVTILDLGWAEVYSGGLPADVRSDEEDGVSSLCGCPPDA